MDKITVAKNLLSLFSAFASSCLCANHNSAQPEPKGYWSTTPCCQSETCVRVLGVPGYIVYFLRSLRVSSYTGKEY